MLTWPFTDAGMPALVGLLEDTPYPEGRMQAAQAYEMLAESIELKKPVAGVPHGLCASAAGAGAKPLLVADFSWLARCRCSCAALVRVLEDTAISECSQWAAYALGMLEERVELRQSIAGTLLWLCSALEVLVASHCLLLTTASLA